MATTVEHRTYKRSGCAVFLKTKEKFGGLSNMAPGFPLRVNGVNILTSEALYQACRFPHLPEVQRLIIDQRSPMTAKMVGKPYRDQTRDDWDDVRARIMRWCLRVKLAQNWTSFSDLLRSTGSMPIVEESRKDDYWGAFAQEDGTLVGRNVLGRLLMELREEIKKPTAESLKCVEPVPIPDFLLFEKPIERVQAWRMPEKPVADPDLFPSEATIWEVSSGATTPVSSLPGRHEAVAAVPVSSVQATTHITPVSSPAPESPPGTTTASIHPRRLIEVDLPIRRISAHARREKSIRHGHISTLHIWWARRPLAACRAVICAALWPDPVDVTEKDVLEARGRGESLQPNSCPPTFRTAAIDALTRFAKKVEKSLDLYGTCSEESRGRWSVLAREKLVLDPNDPAHQLTLRGLLLDFIADFANWDNSTVPEYLETARALTQAAHEALGGEPGTRPLVADPFAGGGSIPLEALRVGADAFASDLNPVPVLLNKVVLEYIPKYGQRLADEVRKWGKWVKEQAEKELTEFYPKDPDGATPIAYLWARTIRCEGPAQVGCGAEVPLLRSLWLAKKGKKSVALTLGYDAKARRIDFEIIPDAKVKEVGTGTVKRGSVTCPCGVTTPVDKVRAQLKARRGGAADARLFCVVTTRQGTQGRSYRLPNERDRQAVATAAAELEKRKRTHAGPISLVPDEPLDVRGIRHTWGMIYGMERWGDFFSPRQLLTLTTLCRLVQQAGERLAREHNDGLAAAVHTCLASAVDRQADFQSSLVTWTAGGEFLGHTFTRQAVPIVWDFCEGNPWADSSGNWLGAIEWVAAVINSGVLAAGTAQVERASACEHPLPDDSLHAMVTDPPYYDAVPYAYLSDFFYVWLRRSVGTVHTALLTEPQVPKDEEIVVDRPHELSKSTKDIVFYERELTRAFGEGCRVIRRDGIGLIVFASKTTSSWEAILKAVVDSGWTITGSWPVDTEREARISAQGQARLASSVHLVCRPRMGSTIGDWRDVLAELPRRIHQWMPRLAQEGVVGADAIFACLGPALEVYSRYVRVEKASGEVVALKEYLEQVWAAVAKEALSLVFAGADASGFDPDARLTAIWLWTLSQARGRDDLDSRLTVAIDEAHNREADDGEAEETDDDDDPGTGKAAKSNRAGFLLEFDAARKIAQGLGAHLDQLGTVVEVKGETARLLPLGERARHLFGKAGPAPAPKPKKKRQPSLFDNPPEDEPAPNVELELTQVGQTVLDRLHQAMLLFGTGRGEALKRFLVEDGVGQDARFWKLAQSLSALYPAGTEEKRWVDGVLGRKKGLGF